MIVVLMGVSGSGKTTVGQVLARALGWTFIDADDYHPAANIAKMRRGIPLDDDDRRPWLEALRRRVDEACARGEDIVLACSALKHAYQEYIKEDVPGCVRYVHLRGSEELIRQRLAARKGHFMNPSLLHSQFETLEPPGDALQVDITPEPDVIAAEIRDRLGLRPRPAGTAPATRPPPS
jgi:gluconokinase